MEPHKPVSIGIASDRDEIAAIDAVETAFGVTIDYADAPTWHSAGDVFRSLQSQLPPEQATDPDTWHRFAAALADQTGVDPAHITPDSPLIDQGSAWRGLTNLSTMLAMLLVAGVALVALLAFALA